jgi:hypothetical protein
MAPFDRVRRPAGPGAADAEDASEPSLLQAGRASRIIQRKRQDGADGEKKDKQDKKTIPDLIAELGQLPPAQQPGEITALEPLERHKLAEGLKGSGDHALIKAVFNATPDGEVDTLGLLVAARFNLKEVGPDQLKSDGGKGIDWDAAGLRQAWQVLEALPPAHVEGNPRLWKLVRYKVKKGAQAEGVYDDTDDKDKEVDQAAIGYDPATLGEADSDFSDEKDPLHGANAFNETMRHEVGHAVDAQLGASDTYCIKPEGGTWKHYADDAFEQVAEEMVAASGGFISQWPDNDGRTQLIKCLAKIMQEQKFDDVEGELHKTKPWKKMQANEQQKILQDPAINAIQKNNNSASPWMGDGGVALGGRVYQESYDKEWNSFAVEARDRKVSKYQFRAPGEWFAEAYAAYYEPVPDGADKGAKLSAVDPKTKAFFDAVVDKMAPNNDKSSPKADAGAKKKA